MEFLSLSTIPYYAECSPLAAGLGYALVELRVIPNHGQYQVRAVITHKDTSVKESIGINDCAKVHRLLLPRFEALLQSQEVYMEVTSPGMERLIKNAAEFELFISRPAKVWSSEVNDWISGIIAAADSNAVTLEISEKQNTVVPYNIIAKAKLLNL